MKLEEIIARAACHVGSTGGPSGKHIFVIITNPCPKNDVLCVGWNTYRGNGEDSTCLIEPGEHPNIKTTSFINYGYAKKRAKAAFLNDVGVPPVSEELYQRICRGFAESPHVNDWVKSYFDANISN